MRRRCLDYSHVQQLLPRIEHVRRRCLDGRGSQLPAHRNSWESSKMWRRRLDRRCVTIWCPIEMRRWCLWMPQVGPRVRDVVLPPVVASVQVVWYTCIQVRRRRLGHRRRGPRWLIPPEARKCSSHGKGRSRLLAEKRHGQYVNCRDGRALRAAKFCQGPRWLLCSICVLIPCGLALRAL